MPEDGGELLGPVGGFFPRLIGEQQECNGLRGEVAAAGAAAGWCWCWWCCARGCLEQGRQTGLGIQTPAGP